jgi:hypothetical protein
MRKIIGLAIVVVATTVLACWDTPTSIVDLPPLEPAELGGVAAEVIYLSNTEAHVKVLATEPVTISGRTDDGKACSQMASFEGQTAFAHEQILTCPELEEGRPYRLSLTLTSQTGKVSSLGPVIEFVTPSPAFQASIAAEDILNLSANCAERASDRFCSWQWTTERYATSEVTYGESRRAYGNLGTLHTVTACFDKSTATSIPFSIRSLAMNGQVFTLDSSVTVGPQVEPEISVVGKIPDFRIITIQLQSNVPGILKTELGLDTTYGRIGYEGYGACGTTGGTEHFYFNQQGTLHHFRALYLDPRTRLALDSTPDDTVRTLGTPLPPFAVAVDSVTATTFSGAIVHATATLAANAHVRCGLTPDPTTFRYCSRFASFGRTTNHALKVINQPDSAKIYFQVVANRFMSAFFVQVKSPVDSFTTLKRPPLEFLSLSATAVGDSAIEVLWSTNYRSYGWVKARLKGSTAIQSFASSFSSGTDGRALLRTNIVGDTIYGVVAVIRNSEFFGLSEVIESDTAWVQTGPRSLFTVTDPVVTAITSTTARLSAETSINVLRLCFEYGTSSTNLNLSRCSFFGSTHNVSLSYLTLGTEYFVRARALERGILPRKRISNIVSFTTFSP